MKLNEIVTNIKEIEKENKLKFSDDTVLHEAMKLFISNKISEDKKQTEAKPIKKATAKQIAYIQELADKKEKSIKINPNLTTIEASKMIEELKK